MDFDSRLADLEACFRDLLAELRSAHAEARQETIAAQARLDECRRLIHGALQPRPAAEPAPVIVAEAPVPLQRTKRVREMKELRCQNGACENRFDTKNPKRKYCDRCRSALFSAGIKARMSPSLV